MVMVSLRHLSIFCSFVILISQTSAEPPVLLYHNCMYEKGNYTVNSTYETNLKTLLSNLSSNTEIHYGFYNFSYGRNSDKVNAIGLCRGDLKPDVCRSCLNDSRVFLTQQCPNQKEAFVHYEYCMLRYSNRSIFGIREDEPPFYQPNSSNVTDGEAEQFNQVLANLMHNLTDKASSGDSRRKFAAGNASAGSQTIFGLVQCTPDLPYVDCNGCLLRAISQISNCCYNKIGGKFFTPSCRIRFETYSFFYDTITDAPAASPPPSPRPQEYPPPPSTNNTESEGNNNTSRTVIATVVPTVAIILLLVFICIYSRVRKSKRNYEAKNDGNDEIETAESLQFHFDTIRVATDNFSDANKLGQGGFGAVFKGRLTNGQEIAVKRLSVDSGQGDTEFKNEVLLVAKLQHRNLVRLLGFCLEGHERLLIYELVQNKSLDYYIFDPIKRLQLNWERRYKIISGIARGLLYLHEDSRLRIIHRDLKVSNILLDEEMNAKISDFGMARLVIMDQTQGNTSRIVGTQGYMAPEYTLYGQFSVKSDIFSFGIMILEIVSGHKNSGILPGCEENIETLLSFTWKHWKRGTVANIIDPTLNSGLRNEILRCIHIGLLCVQENIADRPTMATVVLMLNSHSFTLPTPLEPTLFMDNRRLSNMRPSLEVNSVATGSSESNNKSVEESVNEASFTEPYAR